MRILFSVNNFGFLRNFESALRTLAARGHRLHLLAERKDQVSGMTTVERLERSFPELVTHGFAPAARKSALWRPLAGKVRLCLDYWRYLDPRYDDAPSLRARAAGQAPPFASTITRWPLVGTRPAMRVWQALFHAIERALPADDAVMALLRDQQIDLLLVTPLLYFGSTQVEYVRAARALGIPSVLGVGSWDHLTTKGLIHELPDRVLVWNEPQRTEAATLHGIDPARVVVTGAQAYDHWFAAQPGTTRDAFCARVGVPSDRPLLLYLCSSPFITPHEVPSVRRWIAAIRGHADPVLAHASILIRPHPQNAEQWRDFDPSAFEAVGLWPRHGANPVDAEARTEYFDSMFHSVAVVGVNTSALIESGIVGRPVFTVLSDEFAGQQQGTFHFQHLANVNGGLLTIGRTLDEHLTQLAEAVRGDYDAEKSRAFVGAFVRPHGLDVSAGERVAAAIEAEATQRPAPQSAGWSIRARRLMLRPIAALVRRAARPRSGPPRDVTESSTSTRVLFVIASPEYLRYFDSTMRLLVEQGHRVSVAVNSLRERKQARLDQLVDDPRIEVAGVVPERADVWSALARGVRGTMDFVRYLHPTFAEAPLLRARIYRKVLPPVMRPLDRIRSLSERSVTRLLRGLAAVERAIPVSSRVQRFLDTTRADVIVVSPLIDAGSDQVDTVRAAQAQGTPVVAAIASWDNLTNKGHMRVEPDLVTVWNEHQRTEAVTLHGMSADRVTVTGAQLFDRWFERRPSQSRDAFCAMVGLPVDRPIVLFTGSSVFIARSELEVPFVREWIRALRSSGDPILAEAAVLVRPHPFNGHSWIAASFEGLGPVAVYPRGLYTPAAEEARTTFFDSLYHCAAVVGINTSAMIEAAIVRRPVLSIVTPEFSGSQEGTLHFRYLLPENGGFLQIAHSIEAHLPQLAGVLREPEQMRARLDHFVGTFLRPQGEAASSTPLLAAAIVRARTARRQPAADTIGARLLRPLLWPVAAISSWSGSTGSGGLGKRTRRLASRAGSAAGRARKLFAKRAKRARKAVKQLGKDVRLFRA